VSDSTTDADGGVAYDTGVLTLTKATAADQTATNKYGAAPTAAEIAVQTTVVAVALDNIALKQRLVEAATTEHARANARDDLNKAKADHAAEAMVLAELKGTAATAKGATPKLKAYSGYDFNVALSAASDNGMTFAMGFDMGAGSIADQDDDRAMDAQAGAIGTDEVTITYAGYTVGIGNDNIDDLYDDDQNGDVSLSGSFGDLTFAVVTDMQKDVAGSAAKYVAATGVAGNANYTRATFTDAVTAVYNPTSYSVGYSMGDMSFSMAGTEHDDFGNAAAKYSITTKVLSSLSATLSSDNVGTYKDIGKLAVTYTVSDAMSITASVKDDKDHALNTNTGGKQSQDMSIAYSAGALSATLASDESSNWWVNAKYDLGGGATAFTTFDHTEFLVAGVNFAF
jgi:hypothetical protein